MTRQETADERTHLLPVSGDDSLEISIRAGSIISFHVTKDEQALSNTVVGERLPYNDYTTIDWLHDLVKDSYRHRAVHSRKGLRYAIVAAFDSCQGWVAAALIGIITACIAAVVDMAVATVSDWKVGYCKTDLLAGREACCAASLSPTFTSRATDITCTSWHTWSNHYWSSFGIYVGWALLFGCISGGITMLTKRNLPAITAEHDPRVTLQRSLSTNTANLPTTTTTSPVNTGKAIYMAAGSGIPEIKTILSGFVIPHFLDFKVLVVKAVGSIFAVSTGMNLGKEGPFVHISTCVAYLVAKQFPKYRDNGRKMREILAAGCAAGLSVAFGAPIGGVLFAYEEISTYFPRKVLWRAFICSLSAAIVLRALNPTGTGKLVLFETSYGTTYEPVHYLVFVLLGISGGIFGGIFCKANYLWSRSFRKIRIIKNHPVLEVFLVVLVTCLLQFPNPLTREPGDIVIKNLLVDCKSGSEEYFVCQHETNSQDGKPSAMYLGYLGSGTLIKLVLTIITFGIKVPSGVIIPALDGGAFFGRLVGQIPILSSSISPGIFAMVGAGAFLAGVSRMTISLAVIMFELTGELEFIVPNMIGIMVAKWIADFLEREGVYDLAQLVLGHPFLDLESSIKLVQHEQHFVAELNPPTKTVDQIMVAVPSTGCVDRDILSLKLEQLKERGLMDAGLVLVHADRNNIVAGYLSEGELDFGLNTLGADYGFTTTVRLLGSSLDMTEQDELNLSHFVDQTPLTISETAPMEYAVEMFGRLGLRYLIVTEQGTGRVTGVIIKKRLIVWLEGLKKGHE